MIIKIPEETFSTRDLQLKKIKADVVKNITYWKCIYAIMLCFQLSIKTVYKNCKFYVTYRIHLCFTTLKKEPCYHQPFTQLLCKLCLVDLHQNLSIPIFFNNVKVVKKNNLFIYLFFLFD